LTALAALIALSSNAMAIPLFWIGGPLNGQPFGGGAIQVKATNYDTGSLYEINPPLALNSAIGFGQGGTGTQTVAGGQATMDAAQTRAPLGFVAGAGDSWGILKITTIAAPDPSSGGVLRNIYNSDLSNIELTAMFWGVNDFYLKQVATGAPAFAGAGQIIDGTGLRVDIYSDVSKDFTQVGGPTLAHTVSTYPTATNGTLELSLRSVDGFINNAGNLGGIATEFESNTSDLGHAALNVIGGASSAQFDTNGIGFGGSFGGAISNGLGSQTRTDVWFAFTSTQGDSGWDIRSNDPMLANTVPDTGSTLLMFGLGLGFLAEAYRRRRSQNA